MSVFRRLSHWVLTTLLTLTSVGLLAAEADSATKPQAPAFTLPLLNGNGLTGTEASLSDYQGQVVYLDFWASWCTPCRKSLPWADALYQELKDQGFTVLAINLDEEQEMAMEFLQEVPLSFPVLYDGTGTVPPQYQVVGMPTSYIVDRDGKLRAVHTGFNPASADQVADAIRTLIAGTGR